MVAASRQWLMLPFGLTRATRVPVPLPAVELATVVGQRESIVGSLDARPVLRSLRHRESLVLRRLEEEARHARAGAPLPDSEVIRLIMIPVRSRI